MNDAPQPLAVLLEDNLMFAMSVEPALKRLGYQVRTLAPGPDAAAKTAAAAPELIFLNLTTTRCSGPDLIRELRAQPGLEATAIIGYAGHVESEYLHAGLEAGADLVVPNSALRAALPEVLEKLRRMRG